MSESNMPAQVGSNDGLGPWCRSVRLFAHHKIKCNSARRQVDCALH